MSGSTNRGALPRSLFGRQSDIEFALARVREAADRPGLLFLRGPSAIGKSALLDELTRLLENEVVLLATRCTQDGGDYAGAAGLLGAGAGEVLAGVTDDYGRLRGLQRLADHRAAGRPLVFVLDDAHHCDAATVRWLTFLAGRAPDTPLFLLLTVPCEHWRRTEAMLVELTGALGGATLELGPLGIEDMRALVAHECEAEPDDEFVRVCVEECGGKPGVVLGWLAALARARRRPDAAGAEWLRAEAIAGATAWWLSWLAARTDHLHAYATAVAVLGSAEPLATGALAGLPAGAVAEARTLLTTAGVLTTDGRFRLPELRRALLGAMGPDELTAAAVRGARLLSDEGRPHVEVAEVAMMLPALTEPWMYCALREAARSGSVRSEDAVRYLRRVLGEVPGHVDTRLELATVLGEQEPAAALELYAGVLADLAGTEAAVTVAVDYGAAAVRARRAGEAFPVLAEVARTLPGTLDRHQRAEVDAIVIALGLQDIATVRPALAHAARITLRDDAPTKAQVQLIHQLARAEMVAGESVRRALSLVWSAMPSSVSAPDWWDLYAALTLHHCGAHEEALAVTQWVLDAAASGSDPRSQSLALSMRAALRLRHGDLADAELDAEKALTADPECAHGDAMAGIVLASVATCRGEQGRASELLTELGRPVHPIDLGWVEITRARLLEQRGRYDQAVDRLLRTGRELEAAGVRNPCVVPWHVDATRLLVRLGRMDAAGEIAATVAATSWDTPTTRGFALLTRGLVTADADALEASLEEFAVADDRPYEVQALTALGSTLLREGHDKASRKHLRAAVDLAVRCGDSVAAQVARAELMRAGGRMGELATRPRDVLTVGELRVALLAAEGSTNREIAETLFVTVRTVESHLSNVYRKLGVRTRDGLAAHLG